MARSRPWAWAACLAFFAVSPGPAPGQTLPAGGGEPSHPERALARVAAGFERIRTLRFVKVERIDRGEGPVDVRGTVLYRASDRLAQEVTSPYAKLVVTDGREICVWYPERKVAMVRPLADLDARAREALGIVPGFGMDLVGPLRPERYEITTVSRGEGGWRISLVPRRWESQETAKRVTVDPSRWIAKRVQYLSREGEVVGEVELLDHREFPGPIFFPSRTRGFHEEGGRRVSVEALHLDIEVNGEIPDGAFRPRLPEGTRLVPELY